MQDGRSPVSFGASKRGAVSAAAVSSFIELEFIIQPFFYVMCPPEQDGETEREREGETERGA